MNIKCGLCGKDIVVADELADGQHIQCPYCGEKSEYRKPTRIELPTGLSARRQDTGSQNPQKAVVPEIKIKRPEFAPREEQKPQLRVIRKETNPSVDQGRIEKQMVSRRLHMAEEHVRFYEEMKDIEHRRKTREKINGILLLLVVALCAAGIYWYVGYRKEQRQRTELALAEERNRLDAERAENERKERARREEEEKANRAKRLAEEKRRMEETERIQAEKAKEANALQESKVLYRKVCALFADGEFDFLKTLPSNSLPGKVADEFYFLLPFLDNGEIVVCQSLTNGIESVCRLDESGKRTAFDPATFLASLQGKDYLMACGDRVYFQSKRKKAHVSSISKKEVVDLGKEFFGDIAPEVKRLDLDPEGLRFEIVFIPGETKKVIIADTIEYGAQYSLSKVREAIEDAFPMRRVSVSSSKSRKRYKRTVVFWDGAHIKKGIDGVTYVPRIAPTRAYDRYGHTAVYGSGWDYDRAWRNESKRMARAEQQREHWQSLCDEAKKQEEAESRFYEKQNDSREMGAQSAMTQAERDYAARIDRIYDGGTLYFRAKVDKRR